MQSIPGQCCGQCVKTKCKFNNQLHGVGETWKSPDNCVMFECIRKVRLAKNHCKNTRIIERIMFIFQEEGASTVNYTKKCPPLPRMCKQENILIKDCCEYCNKSPVQKSKTASAKLFYFASNLITSPETPFQNCSKSTKKNQPTRTHTKCILVSGRACGTRLQGSASTRLQ